MKHITRVIAIATLALAVAACGTVKPERVSGAKVTSKERTCFKSSDCRYIVYTPGEQFEITDTSSRKNSADVYGSIEPNKTYDFEVIGVRNPSRTQFRNIMQANNKR